jgi:hypothetical protein
MMDLAIRIRRFSLLQVSALKAGSKEMKKQFKAMDIGDIDVCHVPAVQHEYTQRLRVFYSYVLEREVAQQLLLHDSPLVMDWAEG